MDREEKTQPASDSGYALIAALAAVLAFTLLAFQILAAARGTTALAGAQIEQARLSAAAEAGFAAAINGVNTSDPTLRWPIDGRARQLNFNGVALNIVIEDERGKIPINLLSEDQVRSMFEAAGVSGDRLDILADSYEDWIDDDDDKRAAGAEAPEYESLGIKPRNGAFKTIDELRLVKGMDAALFQRLASAITVNFGESGGFSPKTAQPFAIAVMTGVGMGAPAVLDRQRELSGQVPAMEIVDPGPMVGRRLTLRVTASDDGGRITRGQIIEMTGKSANPYWVRALAP